MTADAAAGGSFTRRFVLQLTGAATALPAAPLQSNGLEKSRMSFMPKFVDLVRNTTTTTGTGDFTLGAAMTGFTSFTAACNVGDSFYYSAIGVDKPAEREVGRGTLLTGGVISRDPIGGVKTNFSSGTKAISLIAAAEWYGQAQQMLGNAGGYQMVAADRTALAASATTSAAYLREPGREGLFVWNAGDCSALVAADSEQGLHVPPASDPTGASGAWARKYTGPVNVSWFGAKADASPTAGSGSDDSAAVQAAIDHLASIGGGDLLIPAHTSCASPLNLDSKHNIRLIGPSGQGAGYSSPPPAQLIYTGTGSAAFISAKHSTGLCIRELGVRYTSASFTGDLIDISNANGGSDAAYALVERCLIGGINVHSARSCINLEGAILCSIVDNHIQWATVGVRGRKEVAVGDILYSNAHLISRNTFDNLTTSALLNAGEGWTVLGNYFEGTDGGSGGMPRAYWDDISAASGAITSALSWIGNWHGDATAVSDAWFCNNHTGIWGLNVSGGEFATLSNAYAGIKLTAACNGVQISGASIQMIDLGNVDHYAMNITGNSMQVDVAGLSNNSSDIWIAGNKINGTYAKTYIRFSKLQEFSLGRPGGGTSPGEFDFTAPPATDLNYRMFADSGANVWLQYYKGGVKRLAAGVDNGSNLVEVGYDGAGGFVGYHRTVNLSTLDVTYGGNVDLAPGKTYKVSGTQVVGLRQTGTPADATDLASAIALINDLKAKLIAHGLIA
jgi:hypothetical protein